MQSTRLRYRWQPLLMSMSQSLSRILQFDGAASAAAAAATAAGNGGRGERKRKCRLVSKQSPTHFSAIFISISFSLHSLFISRSPLSLSLSLSHASAISLWVKFTFYLLRHLSSVAGLELQPELAGSIGRCGCSTKLKRDAAQR